MPLARTPAALFALTTACAAPTQAAPPSVESTPSASPPIEHAGCFMLSRVDGSEAQIVHPEECAAATPPASTFKIPHALIALQLGIVTDPDAKVPWDETPQWMPAWEQDHSLRTALRDSVLWFFQRIAPQIGRERMEHWLTAMHYGNADASGAIDKFWLDGGALRITGPEQLAFVQALFAGTLPIDKVHVDTVGELLRAPIDQWASRLPEGRTMPATTAEFRAKTGTERDPAGNVTWWVGAVDGPRGRWVFVSRVRAPGEPSSRSPAVADGVAALAAAGVL